MALVDLQGAAAALKLRRRRPQLLTKKTRLVRERVDKKDDNNKKAEDVFTENGAQMVKHHLQASLTGRAHAVCGLR